MEKEFKTIEEQIQILKNRNLLIDDEEAIKIFTNNNYYYVINGYKDLFIDTNSKEEKFKENVALAEIYALYKFDIDLRLNFLRYILSLERKIDTYVAYEFSKQYGNKNYMIEANFNNTKANNIKIVRLVNEIEDDMMRQIELGNKMLNHYTNQYGYIPLWVLIRIMTFGQVSKFYGLMKQKEQNAIAQKFKVKEKDLRTYISNLAIIRNICAHDEKLFDIRLRKAISNNEIHEQFNLKLQDGIYSKGYKDLFSIIIIFKQLLEEKEFKMFYKEFLENLEELKEKIKSINFSEIMEKMGLPQNYEELFQL